MRKNGNSILKNGRKPRSNTSFPISVTLRIFFMSILL